MFQLLLTPTTITTAALNEIRHHYIRSLFSRYPYKDLQGQKVSCRIYGAVHHGEFGLR